MPALRALVTAFVAMTAALCMPAWASAIWVPSPPCHESPHADTKEVDGKLRGGDGIVECDAAALARKGAAAVPSLLRMLAQPAWSYSRKVATEAVRRMGPAAAATLPLLLGHVRREAGCPKEGKSDLLTPCDAHPVAASLLAIEALGPASQSAWPDLLALSQDPQTNTRLAQEVFWTYWRLTAGTPAERMRALALLHSERAIHPGIKEELANFRIAHAPLSDPQLPSAEELLLHAASAPLIESYLARHGEAAGIATLLRLDARHPAAPGLRPAFDQALVKRKSLPDLDAIFARAAGDVDVLGVVLAKVALLDVSAPRTIDVVVARLSDKAAAPAVARYLAATRRQMPAATPLLLAYLANSGHKDIRRRDAFMKAVLATGSPAAIPRPFLLEAMAHDFDFVRRMPRSNGQYLCELCAMPTCVAAGALADLAPLPASARPGLERAFLDSADRGAYYCTVGAARLLAKSGTSSSMKFLLQQFIDDRNESHVSWMRGLLREHIGPALPELVRLLTEQLDQRQLAAVESLLQAPAAAGLREWQRARVAGALQAAASGPRGAASWRDAGDTTAHGHAPGAAFPATVAGAAVLRLGNVSPMTPDLFRFMLESAVGPNDEAGTLAYRILRDYHREQGRDAEHLFKLYGAQLAAPATPEGIARWTWIRRMFQKTRDEH